MTTGEALPPSGDAAVAAANFSPSAEHELRLAQLFATSPEVVDAQRPALWQMVNTALATCVDPHSRRAMQYTGHILDWELFGGPTDPLPPSLAWQNNGSTVEVDYNPQTWFSHDCRGEAQDELDLMGLQSIIATVTQDVESRRPELQRTIEAIIETLPAYQFAQSFKSETPPQIKPLPLTPYFRAVFEAQARTEIKRRFKLDRIPWRSKSYVALKRSMWSLDNQTMPRQDVAKPQRDALDRTRAYFGDCVLDASASSDCPREKLDRIEYTNGAYDGDVEIHFVEGHVNRYGAQSTGGQSSIYNAAAELESQLNTASNWLQEWLGRQFLSHLMFQVMDAQATDYDLSIRAAVQQTTDYLIETYIDDFGYPEFYGDNGQLLVRNPPGEYLQAADYVELTRAHETWHYEHSRRLGFATAEELARDEHEYIGEVILRPHDDLAPRLIQSQLRNPDIPQHNPIDELKVILDSEAFEIAGDPYIPGYRLTSRNESRFGFVRDPEGDPYAPANVLLTKAQRQQLAEHYTHLGLHLLAEAVQAKQRLTVEHLTQLIAAHSSYARPSQVSHFLDASDDLLPDWLEARELADFAPLVRDGKLQAQCTISARFLQFSLNLAFGPGSASVIGGNVMEPDNLIRLIGHDQTTFIHNGRLYILDATPPSDDFRYDKSFLGWTAFRPPRTRGSFDLPEAPAPLSMYDPAAVNPEEARQRQLASLLQAFELQLSIVLKAHDTQALADRVTKLSTDDPLRRALELGRRAAQGQTTGEELAALSIYIEHYGEAPDATLRELGVPKYDRLALELASDFLRRISVHL